MSMMAHDAAKLQAAAALPPRLVAEAFPTEPPSEGYAFETALCLVESQSPRLRPALGAPARGAAAGDEDHETRVLEGRVRLLSDLLASLRGQLQAGQWRLLLDAADRVAGELAAALAKIAARGRRD